MNTSTHAPAHTDASTPRDASASGQERLAVAFGISAAIAILFNTVLAWIKESIPAVDELMTALTGHHWWTHGLLDLAVFFVLGGVLMSRGSQAQLTERLIVQLAGAVVIAGLGLAVWFFFI